MSFIAKVMYKLNNEMVYVKSSEYLLLFNLKVFTEYRNIPQELSGIQIMLSLLKILDF